MQPAHTSNPRLQQSFLNTDVDSKSANKEILWFSLSPKAPSVYLCLLFLLESSFLRCLLDLLFLKPPLVLRDIEPLEASQSK
eukprot:6465604-Amphidinium_carterae.2